MVKVLNLNIWNYHNFNKRKPKIIKFIKKHNPDVIVLQEVRDDIRFNKKGNNQAKQLNKKLNFKYVLFCQTVNKKDDWPDLYKRRCVEGTAILSKFPIIHQETIKLKKEKKDRYHCANVYFKIKTSKLIDVIAVHFSPNSLFSKLHLIQTLKYINSKNIKPIIIGDFNIYKQNVLDNLTKKEYKSSIQYKNYISYPSAKWALDYILIPKEYNFESFKCQGNNKISDHKALIAEISIL